MSKSLANLLGATAKSINKLLVDNGIAAKAHTIQVITATAHKLAKPMSAFMSIAPERFDECVKEFTLFNQDTKEFSRSLAVADSAILSTNGYTIDDLVSGPVNGASIKNTSYQYTELRDWIYKKPDESEPTAEKQAELMRQWLQCLSSCFPGMGTAIWVTQDCLIAEEHSNEPMRSAAFLLLAGQIESGNQAVPIRISQLLRDCLVSELVSAHREVVDTQSLVNDYLFRRFLSDSSPDLPLGSTIKSQLQMNLLAIPGTIPILITGESGTGKLAVAKEINHIRETWFIDAERRQAIPHHEERAAILIRANTLDGSAADIRKKLVRLAGRVDPEHPSGYRGPIIIIDDVHRLSPTAQDVLCQLIDPLLGDVSRCLDDDVMCKFVFTCPPGLDSLVNTGDFNSSLYAQISAVEIVCPSLSDRQDVRDEMTQIVQKLMLDIKSAMNLDGQMQLSDNDINTILERSWPGNLRDLKNYLIRLVLEKTIIGRQNGG